MTVYETPLPGLLVFKPAQYCDGRGFFMETWRDSWGKRLGVPHPFVQDNHARSVTKGVLRGLHYQKPPHSQSKLIWVTHGAVYDVVVDLRLGSSTYGQWYGLTLSAENFLRLYIPQGFAHGYITLTEKTEFQYKVDNYYHPEYEGGIRWDDPVVNIFWPEGITPILSDKDKELPELSMVSSPFIYKE